MTMPKCPMCNHKIIGDDCGWCGYVLPVILENKKAARNVEVGNKHLKSIKSLIEKSLIEKQKNILIF